MILQLSVLALVGGLIILISSFSKKNDRLELWLGRWMGFFAIVSGIVGLLPSNRHLNSARSIISGMFLGLALSFSINRSLKRKRGDVQSRSAAERSPNDVK